MSEGGHSPSYGWQALRLARSPRPAAEPPAWAEGSAATVGRTLDLARNLDRDEEPVAMLVRVVVAVALVPVIAEGQIETVVPVRPEVLKVVNDRRLAVSVLH